jgi:hypothetical protein
MPIHNIMTSQNEQEGIKIISKILISNNISYIIRKKYIKMSHTRLVEEFKSLFEKNKWPCALPYTESEIIKFEEINDIILPDQLRFYLTNISSVIIKFSYPTFFCIYQEYLDVDDIVNSMYTLPLHPAFALADFQDLHSMDRYPLLECYVAYYLRSKTLENPIARLTFVINSEWSAPYISDLTNAVTYNGSQTRECDGCHELVKLGDYFYSEEIQYDEYYLDYCEKCWIPRESFLRQQSVLLCTSLNESDDYNIRGNGTMVIGQRGCGLTTNIVLNGPLRNTLLGIICILMKKVGILLPQHYSTCMV